MRNQNRLAVGALAQPVQHNGPNGDRNLVRHFVLTSLDGILPIALHLQA
jgi:hypothetical protein